MDLLWVEQQLQMQLGIGAVALFEILWPEVEQLVELQVERSERLRIEEKLAGRLTVNCPAERRPMMAQLYRGQFEATDSP